MATKTITISPLNDLVLKAKLKEVVAGSLTATPLTTGEVTAFLATSDAPTAAAADPALAATCEHVAGGAWRIAFDAADLDPELLDGLFGATNVAYCIIQQPGGFRTVVPLVYAASRPATIV